MSHKNISSQINIIYRHTQILINHNLNVYGLGSGQHIFLGAISQNEGITQKDLSALLKIDKATTAKALQKLENEEYILRRKESVDKRYNCLYLTPKGKAFLPIIKKLMTSGRELLTKNLNEDQQQQLNALLEIVLDNSLQAVENVRDS